jgi:hypothetical protein
MIVEIEKCGLGSGVKYSKVKSGANKGKRTFQFSGGGKKFAFGSR